MHCHNASGPQILPINFQFYQYVGYLSGIPPVDIQFSSVSWLIFFPCLDSVLFATMAPSLFKNSPFLTAGGWQPLAIVLPSCPPLSALIHAMTGGLGMTLIVFSLPKLSFPCSDVHFFHEESYYFEKWSFHSAIDCSILVDSKTSTGLSYFPEFSLQIPRSTLR